MEALSFKVSKTKYALLLLVSLGFVAIGLWMIADGQGAAGWLGALFFGACAAVFTRQMSLARPRLVIDDAGLYDRTLGVGVIAWADVEDAYVMRMNGMPFLCLALRDPEVYLRRLNPLRRQLARLNSTLGFTELSLNLHGLEGVVPEEIEALVCARAAAASAR